MNKKIVYRRKIIKSGNLIEIEIHPVFEVPKSRRKKKSQRSSAVQKALNDKNSLKLLNRYLHTNFTESDYFTTLTFRNEDLPEDYADAKRLFDNFLKRCHRLCKKNGTEFKWLAVIESEGRFHFHTVISGIPMDRLAKLWKHGRVDIRPLEWGEGGYTGLAIYFGKKEEVKKGEENYFGQAKKWSCSRNLKKPYCSYSDTVVTKRQVQKMVVDFDEREYLKLLKKSDRDEYIVTNTQGGDIKDFEDWKYLDRDYPINEISGQYLYIRFEKRRTERKRSV